MTRAERDNDLIYHQDVPPASTLPPIPAVVMAQSIVDPGLQDPKSVIGSDAVIFGELLGWGARLAIGAHQPLSCFLLIFARLTYTFAEIYADRRQNWITDEVTTRVRRLDDEVSRCVIFGIDSFDLTNLSWVSMAARLNG